MQSLRREYVMKECFTFAILLIGSVMDIRKKELPRVFLLLCIIACALLVLFEKPEWIGLLTGLLPGVVMWIAGRLSGCIGEADSVLVLCLGAMYGLSGSGEQLMYALLLAAVVAIFLISLKHATKRSTLPFVPFLFAGFLLFCLRGYCNGGMGG